MANDFRHYCIGLSATPYAASMVNFKQVMQLIFNEDLISLNNCRIVDKFVTDYAHDLLCTSADDMEFLEKKSNLVAIKLKEQSLVTQDTVMQDSDLQQWKERARFFIAMQKSEAYTDRLQEFKRWVAKRSKESWKLC